MLQKVFDLQEYKFRKELEFYFFFNWEEDKECETYVFVCFL